MASGTERDPILILRIDGEDLQEFLAAPQLETVATSMYSEIADANDIHECTVKALNKLTVDHGMPPTSDPWVHANIVEPSLQLSDLPRDEGPISQEIFIESLKKVLGNVVAKLKDQPVIVAHSEKIFDGSGIKRLFSDNYQMDQAIDSAWKSLPKDQEGQLSREYLRVALDVLAPAVSLPAYGTVDQMDAATAQVFEMVKAEEESTLNREEFNKLITEILTNLMLKLEGKPVTVSSNAVVNEPITSTLVAPSSQ
ncbi:hypothetical protein EJ110_NYTH04603 [Nymphaea thermarum]|nr:hypothetical protein EJ110_NYTH04603 [Nymphaea thermarum]